MGMTELWMAELWITELWMTELSGCPDYGDDRTMDGRKLRMTELSG